MKKVLVLGGNGFIGTNLCKCLYGHGYEVYSFDIRDPKKRADGIKYITGDFFDDIFLHDIVSDKDIIYHAISTIQPGNSNEKYMSGYARDFVESVRLCSYLLGTDKRLIFLSSGGTVYGKQQIQPIKEDAVTLPINHYGNVKLCIENVIRVFNLQMHTKMLIARISNPYGPGQDYRKGVGFIDAAIKKSLNNEVLEVWGDGSTIRDYIYIDDVVEMLYELSKYRGDNEIFNISSGEGTDQKTIIEHIRRIHKGFKVRYTEKRSVDLEKIVLDNSRIMKLYGRDIVHLDTGMEKYYRYCEETNNQGES